MSTAPTPTVINLNDNNPASPAGFRNAKWQASASYNQVVNINGQNVTVSTRDVSSYEPNIGGVNSQSGTTYTIQVSDEGKAVILTNAASVAVTADSTITAFGTGTAGTFLCAILFLGAAGGTITPSSGTINGAASLTLTSAQGCWLFFNGTNWWAIMGGGGSGGGLNGAVVKTADYVLLTGDNGKLYIMNSASAHQFTLPNPPPSATWSVFIANENTGTLTVNRNSLTIDGVAANLTLLQFQGVFISTDGSNYFTGGNDPIWAASKAGVQVEAYTSATDTGSANAYAVALTPAITAYTSQLEVSFIAANANTTTSTLAVNGLTAKTIQKMSSGALANLVANDIVAGQVVTVKYDGAVFQMVGSGVSATQPWDILFNPNIVLGSGAIYDLAVFVRTVIFPGNFAGAQGHCRINPGSTQTITVNKNGSGIGTISITSGGVFSFTTTAGAAQTYNAGDYMSFTAQAGADTGMVLQVTLTGTR